METIPSSLPTSIDSLIFPSASNNFSHTLSALKRSRLSIKNRLSSIYEDSQFVQKIAATQQLPLVANERCGSWYIPTEKKAGSTYFKSTDGHQGQWKFSLRRLNLQVLDLVGEHSG
jgi:tRNA A64-2'-O-ribosylphosphate transferase